MQKGKVKKGKKDKHIMPYVKHFCERGHYPGIWWSINKTWGGWFADMRIGLFVNWSDPNAVCGYFNLLFVEISFEINRKEKDP